MKFSWKNIEIWRSWKMSFFLVGHFEFLFAKKFFFFFFNEKNLGFHMRYHFFLHYGWFLQNLGKEAVRTNMHTTVGIRWAVWADQHAQHSILDFCPKLATKEMNVQLHKKKWELTVLIYILWSTYLVELYYLIVCVHTFSVVLT